MNKLEVTIYTEEEISLAALCTMLEFSKFKVNGKGYTKPICIDYEKGTILLGVEDEAHSKCDKCEHFRFTDIDNNYCTITGYYISNPSTFYCARHKEKKDE